LQVDDVRQDDDVTGIRPVGSSALLVECGDGAEVEAWRAELTRRRDAGDLRALEIVPGARTVLLDGVPDPGRAAEHIRAWSPPPPAGTAEGRRVEIPTVFDGADLDDVARFWGLARDEAVTRLVDTEFRVAFCGFAPGFGYLTGLPEDWSVPRLETPRTRVPAGSVGLAGPYAGVYPTASPGGWRLVGRTSVVLFDVDADPPALLTPGTRVRLVAEL
jgi:KipI family sensor histidine kinase inhibitor